MPLAAQRRQPLRPRRSPHLPQKRASKIIRTHTLLTLVPFMPRGHHTMLLLRNSALNGTLCKPCASASRTVLSSERQSIFHFLFDEGHPVPSTLTFSKPNQQSPISYSHFVLMTATIKEISHIQVSMLHMDSSFMFCYKCLLSKHLTCPQRNPLFLYAIPLRLDVNGLQKTR